MLLFKSCTQGRIGKARKSAREFMFWNAWLQFGNEAYLLISVSGITQIMALDWNGFGVGFSSVLGCLSLVFLIAMPILDYKLLQKYKDRLEEKPIK